MSFTHAITVGPEFFAKAFDDYSDRYWAFAREILQNSLDCGSKRVTVEVGEADGSTVVHVKNDGAPMDRDVLVGKLLSLGGSGKDFQGAVGGFGKAKEVLYFAHKQYTIWTGRFLVTGRGAGYDIADDGGHLDGTASLVTWDGHVADRLRRAFRRFAALRARGGAEIVLDGETLPAGLPAGGVARSLEMNGEAWAEVRLSRAEKNVLVVRVGGLPMFEEQCGHAGTVIVDLLGTSAQRLTSNRDGLRYSFARRLQEFQTSITVDKRSALVREEAEYVRYAGPKLRRSQPAVADLFGGPEAPAEAPGEARRPSGGAGILTNVAAASVVAAPSSPLGHEFVVKNCEARAVPAEYLPESFSPAAKALARAWAGCLLLLHELHEVDSGFAVGFVFSKDLAAAAERSSEHGTAYLLAPLRTTKRARARKFVKKSDRHEVIALAAHEFVHGALGEPYHDEDFARKLTAVMAVVLQHRERFETLFR